MAKFNVLHMDDPLIYTGMNQYIETATDDRTWQQENEDIFSLIDLREDFYLSLLKSIIPMYPDKRDMDASCRESDETLFNRVYVDPLIVNPGFIVETREYSIVVWNAYHDRTIEFTSVSVTNETGTGLDYPTLPKNIAVGYDEVLTLTLYLVGPPIQDTTYQIVAGGFTFNLDVDGIRAIGVVPEPDWSSRLEIRYQFVTVLSANYRYFKEQRRPLTILPWRNVLASYHLVGVQNERFLNTVKYGKDKVFFVPIYTEQIICSTISVGIDSITPTNDFSKFYNLQNNCTHLVFIDHDNWLSEIKEISDVGAADITFSTNIAGTFDPNNTVIYPGVFSTLQSVNMKPESNDINIFTLQFEEFKKNG